MVVLSAAGRFRWCGLRPRLEAHSAESTDGTLTKSATKTILFQYSKHTHFGGQCEAGAVFHDTPSVSNAESRPRLQRLLTSVIALAGNALNMQPTLGNRYVCDFCGLLFSLIDNENVRFM